MSRLSSGKCPARVKGRMWKRNSGASTWLLVTEHRQYDAPLASLSKQWNGGWLLRCGGFGDDRVGAVPLPKSEEPPFDAAEAMFDLIN